MDLEEVAEENGTEVKYLIFDLGKETYGIHSKWTHEIIRSQTLTKVHNLAESITGVTNLRGKIIPIMDLRIKFGLGDGEIGKRTCNIITELEDENGTNSLIGLTVDAVRDVIKIRESDIEMNTDLSTFINSEYITGIIRKDGHLIALLDITKAAKV